MIWSPRTSKYYAKKGKFLLHYMLPKPGSRESLINSLGLGGGHYRPTCVTVIKKFFLSLHVDDILPFFPSSPDILCVKFFPTFF